MCKIKLPNIFIFKKQAYKARMCHAVFLRHKLLIRIPVVSRVMKHINRTTSKASVTLLILLHAQTTCFQVLSKHLKVFLITVPLLLVIFCCVLDSLWYTTSLSDSFQHGMLSASSSSSLVIKTCSSSIHNLLIFCAKLLPSSALLNP